MPNATAYRIFKTRSRTFFISSLFFPPDIRNDVFIFYSFVRTADDFVDSIPAKRQEFFAFRDAFIAAYRDKVPSANPLIDDFVKLMERTSIPYAWIEAFFSAMESDLTVTTYRTFAELEAYMYGSAEIVGLSMCRLIGLPEAAFDEARFLGRAFQYINFIRDLAEDLTLGRTYIPLEALEQHGFTLLSPESALQHPEAFAALIRSELNRYRDWQTIGERGFHYIPRRYLIPIKTAANLYEYTARSIEKNPFIVLNRAVKPRLPRILQTVILNTLTA